VKWILLMNKALNKLNKIRISVVSRMAFASIKSRIITCWMLLGVPSLHVALPHL